MSTHNVCLRGEIRKILYGYPLLSVAMWLPMYYNYTLGVCMYVPLFHVCLC